MRIPRELVGALSAVLVVACSAAAASPSDPATTATAAPSVVGGVGALPGDLPVLTASPAVSTGSSSTTSTTEPAEPFSALGNRMLMIGDSILASTSKRYSNDMCTQLVPLGWQVAVEGEVSRGIDFARTVWQQRDDEPWDVVVVFLGTNYGGDEKDYLRRLNTLINDIGEVGDAEIVLITVSEYEPQQREVNQIIRAIADVYDNISVLDWSEITADVPTLLNEDFIHPTPQGRTVLAQSVAFHVGTAPGTPGKCLASEFTDDSAGSVDGKPTSKPGTKPSTNGGATTTTVKPSGGVTTTTKPSGSTTTTQPPGASTTVGTTTAPTTPPTTPPTSPPGTTPPTVPPPPTTA